MNNSDFRNRISSIALAILLISGTFVASNPAHGAFIEAFVTAGSGGLDDPYNMLFHSDGKLYVSSFKNDQVLRYDGTTGAFIDAFVTAGSGGLNGPDSLHFGPDGNLYVSSYNSDKILRYDGTTGAFIDVFVTAGSGGLDRPYGSLFGPDGNFYVASEWTSEILRYDGTTGVFIDAFVPAGSGGLSDPYDLLFHSDGKLYVASGWSDEILRYDGTTGAFIDVFVTAGSGGLDGPDDVAFGPDGNLYVPSELTDEVLRYDGTTGAFIDAFVIAGSGGLDDPYDLSFGPDGNLYVVSKKTDEILRYDGVATPNPPPTVGNDSGTVDQGSSVTVNVVSNDSDSDGLDLSTITIFQGSKGTATSNGDGTITYVHAGAGALPDSFTYTIDDNLGATSTAATISITVNSVNEDPTAVNDSVDVANLGSVVINVATNDNDPDGALDLNSIVITSNGANGNAVANGDGTVTYTHTNGGTTTDFFSYTISDDASAVSNEAVVSITVTDENIAPTAVNDSTGVDLLDKVILNVTSNDSDSDGTLDLSSLAITAVPQYGIALANSDGTFNYTHTSSSGLTDIFSYTINDNNGKTSNEATVSITVIVSSSSSSTTQSLEEIVEQMEQEKQEELHEQITEIKQVIKEKYEPKKQNQGNGKQAEIKQVLTKDEREKLNFEVLDIITTFYEEVEKVEADTTQQVQDSESPDEDIDETNTDEVAVQESNQNKKKNNSIQRESERTNLPDESAMQKAAKKLGLKYKHGETKVVVELNKDTQEAVNDIQKIAKIDVKSKNRLQVTVGVDQIPKLLNTLSIDKVRAPLDVVQFELDYDNISEGVFFINADVVHQMGIKGDGVKVGVLDLAFDKQNLKIADQVVKTKSFRQGFEYSIDVMGLAKEDGHGTAVAEIVSDVAPNAELYLYTLGTDVEFERAVDEAISDKVDIIVMSAGWPNLPTDGTSHITKKVEEAISHGITFVVPSGNFAEKHWEGDYNDSDENSWHEFNNKDEGLSFEVTKEQITNQVPVLFYLMWDKQEESVNDFDLVLVGPTGEIVDYSVKEQKSADDSLNEFINYLPSTTGLYSIGVTFTGEDSASDASLELFSLNNVLEHTIQQGSVTVPSDAQGVMVVGAVNYFDGKVEPFSSQGPTNHGENTPHVVGPDGITTLGLGNKPFYGTSATAPYIAGIAALLIESNSEIDVEQIFKEIVENADSDNISLEDAYDYIQGYGKADALFLVD